MKWLVNRGTFQMQDGNFLHSFLEEKTGAGNFQQFTCDF